jgi:nucleotide-binding universal stress UspA family protein
VVRSIVIGLDGTAYSSSAIELGLRWARRFDALLVGLGVLDEPTIRQPEPVPLGASYFKTERDDILLARARQQVEQGLAQFAARCTAAGVAFQLLEAVGVPSAHILLEAQRFDLIMLSQQTASPFGIQAAPSETLTQVLKNAPRPVVTVPETLGDGTAVVVAYDGSVQAARALQAFQHSGLDGADAVHIVSVGSDHDEATRHAERAVEFLRFHNIAASPHVLAPEPVVAEVILDQARQRQARLLVMGAYGQPTLREFFLGSVTRTVLQHSQVPLFLFH